MTWIKKETNGTHKEFNFVAPANAAAAEEVLFPIGEVKKPDYAATLAVAINQMETFLQPAELTGNVTVNLTVDAQVTKGAKIYGKFTADGTDRTVTLGTGYDTDAANITVPANGVEFVTWAYDGTAFVPVFSTSALEARVAALELLT